MSEEKGSCIRNTLGLFDKAEVQDEIAPASNVANVYKTKHLHDFDTTNIINNKDKIISAN